MQFLQLSDEQRDAVCRYARCAEAWRGKGRNFGGLRHDLTAGYEVVADGIAVDDRPGHPVIIGDAKDPNFFAAIFHNDNAAIPHMRADDLDQLRRYIVSGEGEPPLPPVRIIEAQRHSHAATEVRPKSQYS